MKFIKLPIFFSLVMLLAFAACNKENIDVIEPDDIVYEPDEIEVNNLMVAIRSTTDDGLSLGCISIQFPFELLLESGMTVTMSSASDFEDALNAEAPDRPVDFVFPLTVETQGGETMQANSNEELGILFASCIPDEGWDNTDPGDGNFRIPAFLFQDLCFDLVYPVDVEDAGGNVYTASNEAELIDLLATTPGLAFVLPIAVLDQEGNETIIESVAGFYELYYSCDGIVPPGTEGGIDIVLSDLDSANCDFETLAIQFPYTIVTDDGESITVEDANQEAALILSGVHYTIQYPFNLVDQDGEVIAINDELEFIMFILPCLITIEDPDICSTPAHVLLFFNRQQGPVVGCGYQINFPMQIEAEGVTYEINNLDDYWTVYGQYSFQIDKINVIYPVSVTLEDDGSTITFNSDEEICAFIADCE